LAPQQQQQQQQQAVSFQHNSMVAMLLDPEAPTLHSMDLDLDLDLDLLPVSPTAATAAAAAPTAAAAAAAAAAARVSYPSFADLVDGGGFPLGRFEFRVGTQDGVVATVLPNGVIRWEETGVEYSSPSAFSRAVVRVRNPERKSSGGWADIKVGGRPLKAWRDAFRAGGPAPQIPEGCRVAV
jgi:hypothetical protein